MVKPPCVPLVPDESGDPSVLDRARAWVRAEYGKPGRVFLGVVHRLDRPVSGACVLARTSKAARRLTEAFRARRVEKVYWGAVARAPEPRAGRLVQWLRKDGEQNLVSAFDREVDGAKEASTRWRVLRSTGRGRGRRVLVEWIPETGRPHQLRVAARTLGTPFLGDLKYGAAEPLPDRSIALHARSLSVPHPTRGELLRFECAPPASAVWRF